LPTIACKYAMWTQDSSANAGRTNDGLSSWSTSIPASLTVGSSTGWNALSGACAWWWASGGACGWSGGCIGLTGHNSRWNRGWKSLSESSRWNPGQEFSSKGLSQLPAQGSTWGSCGWFCDIVFSKTARCGGNAVVFSSPYAFWCFIMRFLVWYSKPLGCFAHLMHWHLNTAAGILRPPVRVEVCLRQVGSEEWSLWVRLGQCQVCCSSLRVICARNQYQHMHESMRAIILQVRILQIQWVFVGYLRRSKNTQLENYVCQYCWNIARNCQNTLGISKAGILWSCAVWKGRQFLVYPKYGF